MAKARSANVRPLTLEESAPLFAALGDETRLQVVARLCAQGPLSIVRLSSGAGVTRQAVTKHLRVLEGAGLVHRSKEGRESLWTLQPRALSDAKRLLDSIASEWDDTIERLRAFVED
jgi:DNA-binding transcriptional ArsR family regulator